VASAAVAAPAEPVADTDQPAKNPADGQPVQHLGGVEPAVFPDGVLGHEGQHRIGAAEGDEGGCGEQFCDILIGVKAQHQRDRKEDGARQQCRHPGDGGGMAPQAGSGGWCRLLARIVLAERQTGGCRQGDNQREGQAEKIEPGECSSRQRPVRRGLQRPAADLEHRRQHQGDDHRLDPGEQDEGQPRRQPARHAMQPPAEIRGELLRLRPRQHHGEGEAAVEGLRRDPAAVLDDFLLHQGDLPGRAAEGQEADLQMHLQRSCEVDCGVLFHRLALSQPTIGARGAAAAFSASNPPVT
jgi:hypothetical protein